MRWGFETAVAAAFVAAAGSDGDARAQDEDPSHGRIDADLTLAVGLGAAVAPRGVRAAGELRLRYLETAGIFATYEEGAFNADAEPQRVLVAGLEIRPLFLFRWLRGYETRNARFDLMIDSLGLELGAVFAQPSGGGFASSTGVQAGLGVELPILARPAGPWIGLHGGLRWSDEVLASGMVRDAGDRSAFVEITLSWHQPIAGHIVDLGDRAPR
jgi:hypothetical protein